MTHRRRSFAAFWLVLAQLFGSSVVGLAHARESLDAPRHIEAANSEQCLVVHDEARCVTCAFGQARATAPTGDAYLPAPLPVWRAAPPVAAAPLVRAATSSGDARAPPISQS